MDDIIWETRCKDALCPMKLPILNDIESNQISLIAAASRLESSFCEWHSKTGHISSQRYQSFSRRLQDFPAFSSSTTGSSECVPCITGKMRNASIPQITHSTSVPLSEVHLDLSGPVQQSFGGNMYAAHFLEPRTAKSDIMM